MRKRTLSICLALMMLFVASISVPVYATETKDTGFATGQNDIEEDTRVSGLITSCSINLSFSGKTLTISGFTQGSDVMAIIGMKNVLVQRRPQGSTGSWTTEKNLGDFLNYDVPRYDLYTTTTVVGGYDYRLYCTHYAKEQGWFFPGTQTYVNYTNPKYVP
jgi:hypothetical protein